VKAAGLAEGDDIVPNWQGQAKLISSEFDSGDLLVPANTYLTETKSLQP
jgi:hypothetical protein